MNRPIRTRFAPAPTGLMHLGNVRTALINYLFARQKDGLCILRIEDTDAQRNFDPGGTKIMEDLAWLGLVYDETPEKGGPYGPYIQSQRESIYTDHLKYLIKNDYVYRCFCSPEELEKRRQRQISAKLPPRYDRTCLKLSASDLEQRVRDGDSFIWRFKLDQEQAVTIQDIAHKAVTFQLKNFSDIPITRKDGTFTFMFTNCVDDITMKISHIFRGEDHLTNTAGQAALFHAFNAPLPTYWHMPILCNASGKKLSKRDFGFALNDLKHAGYLPEAICNYLGIIGGGSFTNEIMDLEKLVHTVNFDHIKTTGHVRYDTQQLVWFNHQWIGVYNPEKLMELCLPFLQKVYPAVKTMDKAQLTGLIQRIRGDIATLKDVVQALHFYFVAPEINPRDIEVLIPHDVLMPVVAIVTKHTTTLEAADTWLNVLKAEAKQNSVPMKALFSFIRMALTGKTDGPSMHDLVVMLGIKETQIRIKRLLELYRQ